MRLSRICLYRAETSVLCFRLKLGCRTVMSRTWGTCIREMLLLYWIFSVSHRIPPSWIANSPLCQRINWYSSSSILYDRQAFQKRVFCMVEVVVPSETIIISLCCFRTSPFHQMNAPSSSYAVVHSAESHWPKSDNGTKNSQSFSG